MQNSAPRTGSYRRRESTPLRACRKRAARVRGPDSQLASHCPLIGEGTREWEPRRRRLRPLTTLAVAGSAQALHVCRHATVERGQYRRPAEAPLRNANPDKARACCFSSTILAHSVGEHLPCASIQLLRAIVSNEENIISVIIAGNRTAWNTCDSLR